MSAVSAKSFQSLINVCRKTVQYLLIICTKFVENLSKFCSKLARYLLKNRIESFLNLSKKLTKYGAIWHNMFKICGILVQKLSRSFKICLNCVQHMYTFFPIYVPTLSTLWLPYLKMFVIIRQNLPKCDKVCSTFAQIMSLLCPNYVENFFRICPKSVQKLSTFCSKSAQNLLKISPTSH